MINRENNFDFLRLLFSSLVVFSHSFPITGTPEILYEWSGRQIDFGALSVNAFFAISGYLVLYSLKFSPTAVNYLWKRCLRVFPALFVMLLFSLLIVPLFYDGQHLSAVYEGQYWKYFLNNLSLYRYQETIRGMFINNPIPLSINGSLWTLKYEFTFYLSLFLLFPLRHEKFKYIILGSLFLTAYLLYNLNPGFLFDFLRGIEFKSSDFYRLATYFFAGSMLTIFNLEKINHPWIKLLLLGITILAIPMGKYHFIATITTSLLVILVGLSSNKILRKISSFTGDLSYGIYIYSVIIQQGITYYIVLTPIQLFFCSYPIVLVLSYFSWNYVEKKMLQHKKLVR